MTDKNLNQIKSKLKTSDSKKADLHIRKININASSSILKEKVIEKKKQAANKSDYKNEKAVIQNTIQTDKEKKLTVRMESFVKNITGRYKPGSLMHIDTEDKNNEPQIYNYSGSENHNKTLLENAGHVLFAAQIAAKKHGKNILNNDKKNVLNDNQGTKKNVQNTYNNGYEKNVENVGSDSQKSNFLTGAIVFSEDTNAPVTDSGHDILSVTQENVNSILTNRARNFLHATESGNKSSMQSGNFLHAVKTEEEQVQEIMSNGNRSEVLNIVERKLKTSEQHYEPQDKKEKRAAKKVKDSKSEKKKTTTENFYIKRMVVASVNVSQKLLSDEFDDIEFVSRGIINRIKKPFEYVVMKSMIGLGSLMKFLAGVILSLCMKIFMLLFTVIITMATSVTLLFMPLILVVVCIVSVFSFIFVNETNIVDTASDIYIENYIKNSIINGTDGIFDDAVKIVNETPLLKGNVLRYDTVFYLGIAKPVYLNNYRYPAEFPIKNVSKIKPVYTNGVINYKAEKGFDIMSGTPGATVIYTYGDKETKVTGDYKYIRTNIARAVITDYLIANDDAEFDALVNDIERVYFSSMTAVDEKDITGDDADNDALLQPYLMIDTNKEKETLNEIINEFCYYITDSDHHPVQYYQKNTDQKLFETDSSTKIDSDRAVFTTKADYLKICILTLDEYFDEFPEKEENYHKLFD